MKSGFVSIIGMPNVGKSTLINRLVGFRVAITSKKAQTTRDIIRGIYTDENRGQIVFVDTPGIQKPRNVLGEYMIKASLCMIKDVDAIIFVIEPNSYISEKEQEVIERLKNVDCPVILAINKIDKINKEKLLDIIDVYSKELNFSDILPISAIEGENIDKLLDIVYEKLQEGPYYYDEDMVTDKLEREIIAEIVREKVLELVDDEIPHGIAVLIDEVSFRENKKLADVMATIVCERETHKGILIGKKGSMLKKIGTLSRQDIQDLLGMKVNLKLFVKVRKDWRLSQGFVKEYGYNLKDLN